MTLYNGYGEHIEHGLSALLVLVDIKPAYKEECRLKKLYQDVTQEQEGRGGITILIQNQSGSNLRFCRTKLHIELFTKFVLPLVPSTCIGDASNLTAPLS